LHELIMPDPQYEVISNRGKDVSQLFSLITKVIIHNCLDTRLK